MYLLAELITKSHDNYWYFLFGHYLHDSVPVAFFIASVDIFLVLTILVMALLIINCFLEILFLHDSQ
ncbi:hypothetical protein 2AV2_165 [Nodularia phage vB_NpeS-2AV2]|uniref:Uncharacterized protein n=3 Tax=Ravarandavirus TaxID=2843444 RepID=A0A482MJP7_9CAUD|nr:hypothetical protein HWA92_gp165 [Nodularia phage vB_NpeS-2AV2]YP_009844988.1 hypothetical protein HWC13_gp132 [Nodularia phage vB_NspS-kac68v161]ALY07617.1 hypothetical protein 2AV2_165 [Nodularia phage vB_NpeS-2AV2]QBQ73829.1 hypothetical protein kac68v161_gp179 [Nodularia phage vB_NspS-kac68v161]QBQ74024.1 hypothetical protein kac68v162_gp176 [Nodularia phage vB_NspS-kac68v162]